MAAYRAALEEHNPRAGAARLGDDAEQPRHRARDARRARERDGAAGGGGGGLSRGAGGMTRASGCRSTGRRRRTNLGTALWTLGERESGTARLEEAVAAYRAALEERTRERVPLDWAMTQNNLGNALVALGRARERDGAAGGGGRGLSRGAGGMDARAGAARLGDDAEQPRQRAPDARASGRAGRRGWRRRSRPIARRWRNRPASGCRSTGR